MNHAMFYTTTVITGMLAIMAQPALAQVTDVVPPIPWQGQLGVIGMMGGLLWWQLAKVGPAESIRRSEDIDRMLNVHREVTAETQNDIRLMTAELKGMTKSINLMTSRIARRPCLMEGDTDDPSASGVLG